MRLALERHFPEHVVEEILGGKMRRPKSTRQEFLISGHPLRGPIRRSTHNADIRGGK
jgi:hypothetical protein